MFRSISLTWQIVKKDLRHVRLPLALWIILMVAKLTFYASIAGVFGAPNENWLTRLQSGVEQPLSLLLDPLIAFFLLGHLIFEDSLAAGDAFWITRPISGGRLLTAKLLGAAIIFFVVPVLVNLPWWLACGFSGSQVLGAVLLSSALYGPFLVIGFTCASLTHGFPRYVLWSIAGFSGVLILLVAVSYFLGPQNKQVQVIVLLLCELALVVGLVVHQFLTRRLRRSLTLLSAGTMGVALIGLVWPWNTNAALVRNLTRDRKGGEQLTAVVNGESSYELKHNQARMSVPVRIESLRPSTLMFVRAQATWSLDQRVVWRREGFGANSLGPATPGSTHVLLSETGEREDGSLAARTGELSFSVSPSLVERMTREPTVFHADLDVRLYDGYLAADLPVRAQSSQSRDGTVMISNVLTTRMTAEMHRQLNLGYLTPVGSEVVIVKLLQRFGDLPSHLKTLSQAWFHPYNEFVLIHRSTGKSIAAEVSRPGFTFLNAVGVLSESVVFKVPTSSIRLEDYELKIFGYENHRSVVASLDAGPLIVRAVPTISPQN